MMSSCEHENIDSILFLKHLNTWAIPFYNAFFYNTTVKENIFFFKVKCNNHLWFSQNTQLMD